MKPSDPILDWRLNAAVPDALDQLGMIPALITSASPNNIYNQLCENWSGGVVTSPGPKWELLDTDYLYYPGLPAMEPIAHAFLRHECLFVYPNGFLCIVQPDGAFTVARLI